MYFKLKKLQNANFKCLIVDKFAKKIKNVCFFG